MNLNKKALLIVSFGVSNQESRAATLDRYEEEVKAAFPNYDFFKAYSSGRVIANLKKQNIIIDTPKQALNKMAEGDYDEVIVQPFGLICGETFEQLEKFVNRYETKIRSIKLLNPMLHPAVDYEKVATFVTKEVEGQQADDAVVFVGHGTYTDGQQAYVDLAAAFEKSDVNAFMGTIKNDLTIEKVSEKLQASGIKNIQLRPFLLTSGYHVLEDIEDLWAKGLEAKGYHVQVDSKALGEFPGVRQYFIDQIHAEMTG
ncbi:MAG: sirohydrochlorin cobaltochelatase [Defluviitaleaceae bacterium]|nr:sirohydrochlorin cobaltochelatase [Defluviitaleaceae bacterium]